MDEFELSHAEGLPPEAWMVKPCEIYKAELKECKSIKARFQQYYVRGEIDDCNRWQEMFNNCMKWRKTQDLTAIESVINEEKQRKISRLNSTEYPEVWTSRENPPSDWNKPIPEWRQKEYENSFMQKKLDEMKRTKTETESKQQNM